MESRNGHVESDSIVSPPDLDCDLDEPIPYRLPTVADDGLNCARGVRNAVVFWIALLGLIGLALWGREILTP